MLESFDDAAIRRMLEAGRAVHADYFTIRGMVAQEQKMVRR